MDSLHVGPTSFLFTGLVVRGESGRTFVFWWGHSLIHSRAILHPPSSLLRPRSVSVSFCLSVRQTLYYHCLSLSLSVSFFSSPLIHCLSDLKAVSWSNSQPPDWYLKLVQRQEMTRTHWFLFLYHKWFNNGFFFFLRLVNSPYLTETCDATSLVQSNSCDIFKYIYIYKYCIYINICNTFIYTCVYMCVYIYMFK